jgi:iron complex outermembrane receptor protein
MVFWKYRETKPPASAFVKKLLSIFVLTCCFQSAMAQFNELRGRVVAENTKAPLAGATIILKGSALVTITDKEGSYSFSKIGAGKIVLVISHVGYETKEVAVNVSEGLTTIANIDLAFGYRSNETIVVSASKRPEKITDAPASIQVIGRKELEQFTGSNTFELLSKVQGVDFIRTGVDYALINARGMNNAFNNKVFQLVDQRNSTTPLSGGLPMQNGFTLAKDDIERIEVVLGPQTALYGPNAHNAIINFIAKDPRKTPGTTASLSAGNRYQFSGRIRQATKVNEKWAYKLTGEYATGRDFEFYDSVYAGGGPNKVFGDTVAIPERKVDFDFRHIRGEAHLYYSLTPTADVIVSAGGSNNNFFTTNTGGRIQAKGLTYSFLQGRYVSKHFFFNIYNTWAGFGNSFSLNPHTMDYWNRTHSVAQAGPFRRLTPEQAEDTSMRYGIRLKEASQRLNGEAQYNTRFEKAGLFVVAGLSYQHDQPNAYGIALVDKTERIKIAQYGAALQLEKSLPLHFRFIGAGRWDHHSNFGNFFSPKLGLIKKIGEGNLRLTWGRAYSMPTIQFQYGNVNGLFYGNAKGITYIPSLTKMSDSVRRLTEPLRPEEVSTWEAGYKGTVLKNLQLDVSGYSGLSKNFFSPSVAVPGRALLVGNVPVTPLVPGVVGNDDLLRNAQFLTVFNFGDVWVYGVDAGLTYSISPYLELAVRYSWIGSNISKGNKDNDANRDGYVAADERSLNAPANKAIAILSLQNLCKQKLFATISGRYTSAYDFYSGNQISTAAGQGKRGVVYGGVGSNGLPRAYLKNFDWGPLGGFTVFDVATGYKFNSMLSAGLNITNLFDVAQREFAGSPIIGRLIMVELKVHVPNRK